MKHLPLFAILTVLWSCEQPSVEPTELLIDPVKLGISVDNWQQQHLRQSVASTTALANQTKRFLSTPGEETRENWRVAWITAHEDFHRATLLLEPETLLDIDVWPIAPGFLDSLPEYPESGIIHDLTLEITSASLREQHMITDRSEASLGFHVLEYYAFDRNIEDFAENTHPLNDRRRKLVEIVSDQLLIRVSQLRRSLETDNNPSQPQATYPELVSTIAQRVDEISSHLNYGDRHGEFSGRDAQVIRTQYAAIYELLNDEVNINRYLSHQSEEQMRVLNNTLSEAIELVPENDPLGEAASNHMQLLAAAISHQFDDFRP